MKVDFVYSQVSDLLFHFLAYIKVHNASNLYSQNYIDLMDLERKGSLKSAQNVLQLEKYYNDNFERLGIINFLPFYCSDLQSFKKMLLNNNAFSNEDKELFLFPLLCALEEENKFYFNYWERIFNDNINKRLLIENYIKEELEKYSSLFRYFKKNDAIVSFSFSLTRNGRGIWNEKALTAIVPFPKLSTDYLNCFFQLLHEYTHRFTDSLIDSSINMSDGTHDLSESLVIIFDYYLIKALNKGDIGAYLDWLNRIIENQDTSVSELEILSVFNIPDALNDALLSMVDAIINY